MFKNLTRIYKLFKKVDTSRLTLVVLFLSLTLSFLGLLVPLALKNIIDLTVNLISKEFTVQQAFINYRNVLIFFSFISCLIIALQLSYNYFSGIWNIKLYNNISKAAFKHLHTLSLDFFERQFSGSIREKTGQGSSDIKMIANNLVSDFAPQIIVVLIASFVLFQIDPLLTIITLIGLPIFVFISIKMTKVLNLKQDKVRDLHEKASGLAIQSIAGIKTVKSYNRSNYETNTYEKFLDETLVLGKSRILLRQKLNLSRFIIIFLSRFFAIAYSGYLALNGQISVGAIYLFFAYTERIYGPMWRLTQIYDILQERMRSAVRVLDLLEEKPIVHDKENAIELKRAKGIIEFKNIHFSYNDSSVLKGLNVKINSGEVIALVGPSGVGKSTIAKLILRLYDPNQGSILIDGNDIKDLTQKSLRKNIGVVLQDTILFNNTVSKNIKYSVLGAKNELVEKAAKIANAHDFISALPKGYNTLVGERGVKLSGGEQQRINIARAVLKNAPILILDEATSHLDSESEHLVQEALWKLIEGKTTIIIAHRLSTVMKADKILVLNKGKIVEEGKHEELIKEDGLYAKLFKIQSGAMLLTDKEESIVF